MGTRKYTDEQFIEAVKTSRSWREALEKIGLKGVGGNYKLAQLRAKKLGATFDNFLGAGWRRGSSVPVRSAVPLSDILVENSTYTNTHKLKKRLIKEGIKKHECEICHITEWLGKATPIELDHINGDHFDRRLINLRLLCPNCHAQTTSYRKSKSGRVLQRQRDET